MEDVSPVVRENNNCPEEKEQSASKRRRVYTSKELHQDLEEGRFSGTYGAHNSIYMGMAEVRAGVNLKEFHKLKKKQEFLIPSLVKHLQLPSTQKNWDKIATMDPYGLTAKNPTIGATTARMTIPEIQADLARDGVIVNEDGSVNVIKAAIELVWNLPLLASKLNMPEKTLRECLYNRTYNPQLKDETTSAYLPPVGGITVYFFGDLSKLSNDSTEIAVRVHDECNGSDVFGTDICTCRPYLMFAVQGAIECAQRGGVGIVAYFRKEGRSLGEVIKFRVYNARKNQEGGDRPEKYFYQTESIAGIRDARFQEMMPDILTWVGIKRIDWLFSMSSEKYDAISAAGIQVMQRISLPDSFVPKNAFVEITAKISSGYHTDHIRSEEVIDELRDLRTVRNQCKKIYSLATQNRLAHWKLNLEMLPKAVKITIDCINKFYPDLKIPYHSRFRHFGDRIPALMEKWPCDSTEKVRRLLDLVTVSVLLDAGAGPTWTYTAEDGKEYTRSEGLAIASLDMFTEGLFSSDRAVPCRVDYIGLKSLTKKDLARGFQVTQTNPVVGLDGRTQLLQRLGEALERSPQFFGQEVCRPGHIADYVLKHAKDKTVSLNVPWTCIIRGFESIWPKNISGVRRGDVWQYYPLKEVGKPGSDMVPFHKLSQWLLLSMLEPLEKLEGVRFIDMDLITALAEYRNGGLLVDAGVIEPIDESVYQRQFAIGSELVVEWRALTVSLIDVIGEKVREHYKKTAVEMPLPMVLEGGTWRAGRILAKTIRKDASSPIHIRSDGTVF